MNNRKVQKIKQYLRGSNFINELWLKCKNGEYDIDDVLLSFDAVLDDKFQPIRGYNKVEKLKKTILEDYNKTYICCICGKELSRSRKISFAQSGSRTWCLEHDKEGE